MEINISSFINQESSITSIICNEKYKLSFIESNMSYISLDINNYYQDTILEILIDEIKNRKLEIRNPRKRILNSLKIVGLDESYLRRSIRTLSTTEKKLIQLAIGLLSNPEILILDNFFRNIDLKLEKKLIMLFQRLKDNYNKTIILLNNDLDKVYKYSDYFIIIKNSNILLEGNFKGIVSKIKLLKDNNIYIPDMLEFTYLVREKKKVNIDYYKDIRDLIKDIYKHV